MIRKKEFILLVIILLIGSILRFWNLGHVPFGATLDEMGYIFNSYSIAFTGKNVFDQPFPLFTWMVPNGFPFMPVPIYLSAPFFRIFDLSLTTGRLLTAVLGIVDIFLLFQVVRYLFGKISLALLSAFFLAISPWHLHFSRSAYDPNYSLFFFLLGIVLFIWEIRKKKTPILSTISFLLAVFSYRGMSIIAFPILFILLWYGINTLHASRKQISAFILGITAILICLVSVVMIYGTSYTAEGSSIINNPKMQEDIDNKIRVARGSLFIKRLFNNKPTYILDSMRENYVKSLSPEFLFLYTEPNEIYSIWSRGRIYFIDIFFIFLGAWYLFSLKKKGAFFVLGLLLIGALPGGIGGSPFSARNLFQSLIFPIFVAGGVIFLIQFSKFRFIVIAFIVALYTYALSSYLFDYYGRYAYQSAEVWGKSFKDLSQVINEQKDPKEIQIGPTSHGDFIQFAFYSKLSAQEVQTVWAESTHNHNGPFTYRNITFMQECPISEKTRLLPSTLYIVHEGCDKNATPSGIIKDYWGNSIWKVYNGK